MKGVDGKPEDTVWGQRAKFGELVAEFGTSGSSGWVHSVCFSDDGKRLAYVAHDSTVYVVDGEQDSKWALRRTWVLIRI